MMPYNNGFPMSYPQYYSQYQQNGVQSTSQSQQMMSPPTIHAEIVQVNGRDDATNFPVGAGQAQMMIAKDESSIFIKSAFANGQSTLTEYIKKPPEPEKPIAEYITRDEFESRISEIINSRKRVKENEQSV